MSIDAKVDMLRSGPFFQCIHSLVEENNLRIKKAMQCKQYNRFKHIIFGKPRGLLGEAMDPEHPSAFLLSIPGIRFPGIHSTNNVVSILLTLPRSLSLHQ